MRSEGWHYRPEREDRETPPLKNHDAASEKIELKPVLPDITQRSNFRRQNILFQSPRTAPRSKSLKVPHTTISKNNTADENWRRARSLEYLGSKLKRKRSNTLKASKSAITAAPLRRCHSCNRTDSPDWIRGPNGTQTFCNVCGLHYARLERKRKMEQRSADAFVILPGNLTPEQARRFLSGDFVATANK
ncbi:hypothetical protein F4678DRAFT_444507 [Xylaria arbuscula]|nr:hypothetical protein F4678DRAFT_444507 [Xylaria arbuscula]